MYRNDKITAVKDRFGNVEAHVFRGKGGFFFLDLRSDAEPLGPFKTRERAELSAGNCCETERWCNAVTDRERREAETLFALTR